MSKDDTTDVYVEDSCDSEYESLDGNTHLPVFTELLLRSPEIRVIQKEYIQWEEIKDISDTRENSNESDSTASPSLLTGSVLKQLTCHLRDTQLTHSDTEYDHTDRKTPIATLTTTGTFSPSLLSQPMLFQTQSSDCICTQDDLTQVASHVTESKPETYIFCAKVSTSNYQNTSASPSFICTQTSFEPTQITSESIRIQPYGKETETRCEKLYMDTKSDMIQHWGNKTSGIEADSSENEPETQSPCVGSDICNNEIENVTCGQNKIFDKITDQSQDLFEPSCGNMSSPSVQSLCTGETQEAADTYQKLKEAVNPTSTEPYFRKHEYVMVYEEQKRLQQKIRNHPSKWTRIELKEITQQCKNIERQLLQIHTMNKHETDNLVSHLKASCTKQGMLQYKARLSELGAKQTAVIDMIRQQKRLSREVNTETDIFAEKHPIVKRVRKRKGKCNNYTQTFDEQDSSDKSMRCLSKQSEKSTIIHLPTERKCDSSVAHLMYGNSNRKNMKHNLSGRHGTKAMQRHPACAAVLIPSQVFTKHEFTRDNDVFYTGSEQIRTEQKRFRVINTDEKSNANDTLGHCSLDEENHSSRNSKKRINCSPSSGYQTNAPDPTCIDVLNMQTNKSCSTFNGNMNDINNDTIYNVDASLPRHVTKEENKHIKLRPSYISSTLQHTGNESPNSYTYFIDNRLNRTTTPNTQNLNCKQVQVNGPLKHENDLVRDSSPNQNNNILTDLMTDDAIMPILQPYDYGSHELLKQTAQSTRPKKAAMRSNVMSGYINNEFEFLHNTFSSSKLLLIQECEIVKEIHNSDIWTRPFSEVVLPNGLWTMVNEWN